MFNFVNNTKQKLKQDNNSHLTEQYRGKTTEAGTGQDGGLRCSDTLCTQAAGENPEGQVCTL